MKVEVPVQDLSATRFVELYLLPGTTGLSMWAIQSTLHLWRVMSSKFLNLLDEGKLDYDNAFNWVNKVG